MPNVVRITLTLLCLFGSWSPVQAWVTEEHILIGEAGYRLACEGFRDPQVVRTEAQRGRAQQFCFQDPDLARRYGELTAYGGDYAAEPEDIPTDFDTMSAQLAKLSDWSHIKNLLHRAKLALKDGTHFQPHAEEQWWHYHQRALTLAQQASTAGDADEGFRRVLVVSGFADHFLQDAFSAGHNGTDRMTTIPSLQKVYHDAFCCWGRFLANGLGETWFALGDGGLDKFCNRDGRQRVIAATAESVRSVLWHFIVGDGVYKEAQEVFQYLPKRYADQTFKLIPPQYDSELCPKPDFPMVRFRGRYLKCSDPDFFEVYVNPQLRPATQRLSLGGPMARTPIHPGEILADELQERGMSALALAKALHVPANRIAQIVSGKRGITADTALRLSQLLGTTPDFWINLQKSYELRRAEQEKGEEIRRLIKPLPVAAE